MKNLIVGLLLLGSFSAFAGASIRITMPAADGFQSDEYTIPSTRELVEVSLIVLSHSARQDICYTGTVAEAKRLLDNTVIAASNVKKYSSFTDSKYLSVDITTINLDNQRQLSRFVMLPCRK